MNSNLQLDFVEIYNRLNKRNWSIKKETLLSELIETLKITELLTSNLNYKNGLEKNDKIGLINPLLWEYGHTLHFWEHIVLKNLGYDDFKTKDEVYNSFLISRNNRFNSKKLLSRREIILGYQNIMKYLNNYINNYDLSNISTYLIRLGQLHLEMHNESFVFTNQLLGRNVFDNLNFYKLEDTLEEVEMINVSKGSFLQGVSFSSSRFYFDNEAPEKFKFINSFQVSKYCITNYQYLKFVNSNGYNIKKYWSDEGWDFIKNKKLDYPIYWERINNNWFEKIFDKLVLLRNNNPVINISWYEASAYCKWKGVRLLKEEEWEYLAKLGNEKDNIKKSHLNYGFDYNYHTTISVLEDESENNIGVVGLFGNCWEWCEEPFYPYDGFVIDPVYREMSYPHFGYKRICRGGSWAVPNILINSHYRNAQSPDCCHQFIGFRVAVNKLFYV
jgi:gamma-glutamyl hercynylcysteine S-oxide synthase